MSLRDTSARVAALTVLRDMVDEELVRSRRVMFAELSEAHDEDGVKSVDVKVSGRKVGSASLAQPKPKPVVTDERAFGEWVAATYPAEIVRTVSPGFRTQLLKVAEDVGDGEVCDPESGDIIPGIVWQDATDPTTFSLRFDKEGREMVALALRALPELRESVLALPEGATA